MNSYTYTQAIVRQPGPDLADGLTTSTLGAPSYELALEQHAAYVAALRALGLDVQVLPALPACPDAYFVEDPAVVLPEVAIITRPGAPSRRGEVPTIAEALAAYRETVVIESPGTLEGGDVMMVEDRLLVGLTERTNCAGFDQLADIATRHGFEAVAVPLAKGLHLKTDMSYLGDGVVLCTAPWQDHPTLQTFKKMIVPADEAYAANALRVNDSVVMASGYPKTRALIEPLGLPIVELDVSEPRKMDGGLSCMSLRF